MRKPDESFHFGSNKPSKMIGASGILKLSISFILAALVAGRNTVLRDGIQTREWPCPVDADIAPCVCTSDADFNLFMECSQVKTSGELTTIFTADFPFVNFVSLTIDHAGCTDCNLNTLPADVFGGVGFQTITITGTNLQTVEEQAFSASHETLKNLRLSSNKISAFPFESLGDFKILTQLRLNSNKFNADTPIPGIVSATLTELNLSTNDELVISPDLVTNCPEIRIVSLRSGKIPSVPLFDTSPISMFTGLTNVHTIDFAGNAITEIQTNSIVSETDTLTKVDFSHNDISIVHPTFVTGFSPATGNTLLMADNKISFLDEKVWAAIFEELPVENSVDLSQNPILCGCEIAWLVNSSSKKSLTETTLCEDGVQVVKNLPPAAFVDC